MEKINFIASAGTGKTYTLVRKIVDEYMITRKMDIDRMFISTFTEKAASELRSRIYSRIKEKIYENRNDPKLVKWLLHNFYNIQHSYIGTIHSLLLRMLKANPALSGITEDVKILDEIQQEALFFESFETFLESNQKRTEDLARYFSGKKQIYAVFKSIYANLWKIDRYREESVEKYEKRINQLKDEVVELLELFIHNYYKDFVDRSEFLKTDLKDLYAKVRQGMYQYIKIDKNKNFPKLLKHKYVKNMNSFKGLDRERVSKLEDQLIDSLEKLKSYSLFLNFLVILDSFEIFFDIFESKKKENNFFTYDDIILKSREIFSRHPDILSRYREKFKVFFIDEFQDTDQIQTEVLKILSEKSDLVVFGDPKQCIYEWRSADLYNYIRFTEGFKEETLDVCHRSSVSLIGFFNLFFKEEDFLNRDFSKRNVEEISHLEEKYIPELKFPSGKEKKVTDAVEVVKTERELEPVVLAKKIKQLLKSGYKPEDILVLFRSRNKTDKYMEELRKANIPFVSYLSSNFYNSVEIVTVLNIMKLIQYPYDQLALVKVLKSPVFSFSDKELYEIKNNLSIDGIKQLRKIKDIEKMKDSLNISEIIDILYAEIPLLEIFSLYPDGKQKVANLEKLRFIASRLEDENFQLRDFIQFLEESRFRDEEEAILTDDTSFVRIMTMHQSKGLEANVVIIPGLSEKVGKGTTGFFLVEDEVMVKIRDEYNREIARTLNFDEEKVKQKIYLEEKRLLYVAFTRAKEKLILLHSGSRGYMNEIEKVIDCIQGRNVEVATDGNDKVKFRLNIDTEEILERFENTSYWRNIKKESDDNVIRMLLSMEKEEKRRSEEFRKAISSKRFTTVSSIINERDAKSVMETFQISEDENLKTGDIHIEVGFIIHKILEYFTFPLKAEEAEREIKDLFNKFSGLVTEKNKKKIEKISLEKLKRFIRTDTYRNIASSRIIFREMPFTLKEGNRFIEGKIDIVYEKEGIVYVGDYKTGRIKDESRYEPQRKYYTKVVKEIFPNRKIIFQFIYLI
ncbi:UvrD-helicase domain-containing protein [Persephonella sp.]